MAADDSFERRLAIGLHDLLDGETPPHPTWSDAPAAQHPTGRPVLTGAPRRGAVWLLVAAILVALVGTLLAVAGGRFPLGPTALLTPSPTGATASPTFATPSASPTTASPSATETTPTPTGVLPPPSPGTSQTCADRFSDAGITTDPSNPLRDVSVVSFPGYDRVTFQAGLAYSGITVEPVSPPFTDASGKSVTVDGSAFYSITLDHAGADKLPAPALDQVGPGALIHHLVAVDAGTGASRASRWIVGLSGPACVDVFWAKQGANQAFMLDLTAALAFSPVSGSTCLASEWSGTMGFPEASIDHLPVVEDVHLRDQSVDFRIASLAGVTVRIEPAAPPFTLDPSGLPVTVAGTSYWRVVLTGVEGSSLPTAERDEVSLNAGPSEVREIGDFEGVETWIIGEAGPAANICPSVAVAYLQGVIQIGLAER